MDALRNILVLMEPGGDVQPAFDAALTLARRFGARLELLMSDYQDLHAAYFEPPSATGPSARRCGARRSTRSCSAASRRRSPTSS